jgi:hypothetical protein
MYTLKLNKDQLQRILKVLHRQVEVSEEYNYITGTLALINSIEEQSGIRGEQ